MVKQPHTRTDKDANTTTHPELPQPGARRVEACRGAVDEGALLELEEEGGGAGDAAAVVGGGDGPGQERKGGGWGVGGVHAEARHATTHTHTDTHGHRRTHTQTRTQTQQMKPQRTHLGTGTHSLGPAMACSGEARNLAAAASRSCGPCIVCAENTSGSWGFEGVVGGGGGLFGVFGLVKGCWIVCLFGGGKGESFIQGGGDTTRPSRLSHLGEGDVDEVHDEVHGGGVVVPGVAEGGGEPGLGPVGVPEVDLVALGEDHHLVGG